MSHNAPTSSLSASYMMNDFNMWYSTRCSRRRSNCTLRFVRSRNRTPPQGSRDCVRSVSPHLINGCRNAGCAVMTSGGITHVHPVSSLGVLQFQPLWRTTSSEIISRMGEGGVSVVRVTREMSSTSKLFHPATELTPTQAGLPGRGPGL